MTGAAAAVPVGSDVERLPLQPRAIEGVDAGPPLGRDQGLEQHRVRSIIKADDRRLDIEPFLEAVGIGLFFMSRNGMI